MKKVLKVLKDIVEVVLVAFAISFLITRIFFMSCQVDGKSMVPTLQDYDRGFSSIISSKIKIDRFDIAVVDVGDKLLVKRVIGMPNDKVEYINNKLFINGQEVEENYSQGITNDFSIQLNDDEYYCLGDNREVSRDSRYYGPFNISQIKATHILVIYPFSNFGYHK